jgi:HAD domain in Swiss Army Knife RNA repair proteins
MVNRPVPAGALLAPGDLSASTVSGTLPTFTCMEAKERAADGEEAARPLLMVDIDGVISLFGGFGRGAWATGDWGGNGEREDAADGSLHSIDGIPHFLSSSAAAHLLELADLYELVWASGWEERADEHLPHLLGLPRGLPFLRFARAVGRSHAHWKLEAIDSYAGGRALAWIDDSLDAACERWARERQAPTLLVRTRPEVGLTRREAQRLADWALALAGRPTSAA